MLLGVMMPIPEPFASEYRIATDREIRSWSFGEISKPRVANSAPFDEHIGTLNDQRIFGTLVDYRCACGKYDGITYDGMVCDRCGVKITSTDVRKSRFGHIDFKIGPIAHPFDPASNITCFPVIAAVYLQSGIGNDLGLLYEQLLADTASLIPLIEFITPIAADAIQRNSGDSQIFTRGLGLTLQIAT